MHCSLQKSSTSWALRLVNKVLNERLIEGLGAKISLVQGFCQYGVAPSPDVEKCKYWPWPRLIILHQSIFFNPLTRKDHFRDATLLLIQQKEWVLRKGLERSSLGDEFWGMKLSKVQELIAPIVSSNIGEIGLRIWDIVIVNSFCLPHHMLFV